MCEEVQRFVAEEELQGIVFDCDGTLVDSMPVYWKSWQMTCRKFGLTFTWERFHKLAGVPVKEIIKLLIDDLHSDNPPDVEEVYHAKKGFADYVAHKYGTPAIPPVLEVVKKYHGKVPLAVASSGTKGPVIFSLESAGILQYFDEVVTSEGIPNPKPAPDIFLEACRRIGCDPQFCRGYEDADLGLLAVKKAGMEAIDVRKLDGYPSIEHPPVDTHDEM